MKRYFVFRTGGAGDIEIEDDLIGMVDTPEEAATLLKNANSFVLYELVNERFQAASRWGFVTNTTPNPDEPDNHNRRVVIYFLEMSDGTLYEVKREKQKLIEPKPSPWVQSGSITSGNVNINTPFWTKETDELSLPTLLIKPGRYSTED